MTTELVWLALSFAISVLGILGVFVCRLGEKSDRCFLCRVLFVLTMLLVAAATLASVAVNSTSWVLLGATLAAMAVGVTWQLGADAASEVGR